MWFCSPVRSPPKSTILRKFPYVGKSVIGQRVFSQDASFIDKKIVCHKYFRYFKFTIISAIMTAKFNLSIAIIIKVSLLGYAIYFSAGVVCVSFEK